MKKNILTLIKSLFVIAALLTVVTAVSCGGVNNLELEASKNPVLKIIIPQSARTILPDSDFSAFAFELKSGQTLLGSYTGLASLADDVIDLKSKGIKAGDEISLTLTAQKDQIKWEGSASLTVKASENRVEIPLLITALGSGNGSFSYTLDLSQAEGAGDIVSAHVIVTPLSDSNASPVLDQWYGLDAEGNAASKTISADSKILVEKADLPAGNYRVKASFYAEGLLNAKVLDWYENIAVAAGTVSRGTSNINKINKAYTVTFDLNYQGSFPFQKKVSYFTDIDEFKPERDGYVFKGWFRETDFTHEFKGFNVFGASSGDLTVYAKWDVFAPGAQTASVFNEDSVYVNPENYTIGEIQNATDSFWYKINTSPGAQYKITWIDYWSYSKGSYVYNGDLMAYGSGLGLCEIALYTRKAEKLVLKNSDGSEIPGTTSSQNPLFFTAETSETYINVSKYVGANTYGKYAFRVVAYDPSAQHDDSLSAFITVLFDDIGVTCYRSGNTGYVVVNGQWTYGKVAPFFWSLYVPDSNNYESFKWYVNGKSVSTSSSFDFKDAEYPLGIYTVTVEAVKKSDGKLYSYSAQIEIIGSDKEEGGI